MKVALVYDRVNKFGGAERLLLALHEIWPEAPLYTSVYDPKGAPWACDFKVFPSFMQNIPFAKKHHEMFPWLTPFAFETFNFKDFDAVVCVTSAEAKAIIVPPETLFVCYCLTPTRYLWSHYYDYFTNKFWQNLSLPIVSFVRISDYFFAQKPDLFIAISKNISCRIKKYYRRESIVVYPPVDEFFFSKKRLRLPNLQVEGYFLVVSRLVGYKKVEIVVDCFNKLSLQLVIIGEGSERPRLKKRAKRNIFFMSNLTDAELLSYYQNCRALIMPQEEDFGLVALEAQAAGKPVIAYAKGGALELIIQGKTGEFFFPQDVDALKKIVRDFDQTKYNKQDCQKNAYYFSKKAFKNKFKNLIEKQFLKFKQKNYDCCSICRRRRYSPLAFVEKKITKTI